MMRVVGNMERGLPAWIALVCIISAKVVAVHFTLESVPQLTDRVKSLVFFYVGFMLDSPVKADRDPNDIVTDSMRRHRAYVRRMRLLLLYGLSSFGLFALATTGVWNAWYAPPPSAARWCAV
jgi:hypothetical protein